MKLRHFYLLLIILLGEGIIITAFKHFGKGIDENVLNSNIIIASLIFILFAIELVNPIINIKDEAQSSIGGIGIRWTFSFIFVAGSISVMA